MEPLLKETLVFLGVIALMMIQVVIVAHVRRTPVRAHPRGNQEPAQMITCHEIEINIIQQIRQLLVVCVDVQR